MIPDYQTCMLPLLKYAGDNNEHKFSDAVDYLSNKFNLTQEERKELLPSKTQDVIRGLTQAVFINPYVIFSPTLGIISKKKYYC